MKSNHKEIRLIQSLGISKSFKLCYNCSLSLFWSLHLWGERIAADPAAAGPNPD